MGKKLTKKLLVFLTLMCMIIGMNVSVSAETGSTGNTKAISAAENPADGTLQVWLEYEDDAGVENVWEVFELDHGELKILNRAPAEENLRPGSK